MKVLKGILSFIFAVILAMVLFAVVIVNVANVTILNEEYVLSVLTDGFYDEAYEQIISTAEEYLEGTNFEGLDVEEIISKEKVKSDIETIIDDIYTSDKTEIDTTEIEENLNEQITKTLGKTAASLMQDSINEFVDEVCNEYKTQMESINSTELDRYADTVFEYVDDVEMAVEVGAGVLIILILLINLSKICNGVRWLGFVFEIDGVSLAVLNILMSQNLTSGFSISTSMESVTFKVISDILSNMINYAYAFVGIGLVCIVVSELFVLKDKKSRKPKKSIDDDF